jgi:hypothetical protein
MDNKCAKKDEEIKQNQRKIDDFSEVMNFVKDNINKDQQLLDMIEIHSSIPDFLEVIKTYMGDRKANPVYYQLITKAMKFDFLRDKIGIDR